VVSRPERAVLAIFIAAKLAVHLVFDAGYGVFRDELYYLACADHMAWGYVDHPPLSIAVLFVTRLLFGDSLFVLRLVPALAGALAVLAQGYGSLGSAAEHSQHDRYATASAKIRSGRDAAAGALADLRAAGYDQLPALASPALAALRSRPKPKRAAPTPTTPSIPAPTATAVPSAPSYTPPQQPSTPQSKYGPRKGSDG